MFTPTRRLVRLCYLRIFNKLITLTKKNRTTTEFSFLLFLVWTSEWINSSVRLFAAIEAYTIFFFCFEEPRWLTCGPKLLSLPNISHEALINKLNIRTLARKFVYFQIRKNNTYQVVFIGAQRSFHSLSLATSWQANTWLQTR